MPKQVQIIRLFVGSTAEMAEERLRLNEVVEQLNLLIGSTLGLRLELVKWETHARPGLGIEPQAVIDEQIGDCDIFLGMLWTKFGTPTNDAASGTEHEFNNAYSRWKADPNQVSVMFYFKDSPIAPSQVDVSQLLKVEEFKRKLGVLGALYWKFNTADEFKDLVSIHLGKELVSWTGRLQSKEKLKIVSRLEVSNTAPEEGFIDLLETVQNGFGTLTQLSQDMGTAIEKLGENLKNRTTELNHLQTMDQSSRLRYLKRIASGLAEDLHNYSNETESKIPLLGKTYRQTTSALTRAVSMSQEFGGNQEEEIPLLLERMRSLLRTLSEIRSNVQAFREVIRATPRATSEFIAAQNRTVRVLDTLDREFEGITTHTQGLLDSLESPESGV